MAGSVTELVKEKLDIVEFIRGYLQVQPAGKNWKALCPFHLEKTPSFMISPERQAWHCFGCGAGGDIFGFLMKYENLEFGEALQVLAEKAGVELQRFNPQEYKLTGLLYDLNEKAKEYFKRELQNSELAKKYLADRHLNQKTIEEFELGWAPTEAEGLTIHLLNAGYSPDDLLRAGLVLKNERGLLCDRFRGRIMFPIHNHFGRVVGFTGRVLPQFETEGAGKYVNSPETAIFQKSRLLYGFWKSKNFIREAGSAFLVEGQMDALMSWQTGIKNVVATSGTSLTDDHLRTLRRFTDQVILSFDNDSAGSAAAERAIDMLEANDFGVKVVVFDEFKDPAEAVEKNPAALIRLIENAVPAPRFYFKKYLAGDGIDYSSREGLRRLRAVLEKLKMISNPVEQAKWVSELGKLTGFTGIQEKVLFEELERIKLSPAAAEQEEKNFGLANARRMTRRELIGERLLRAAAASGNYNLLDDCKVQLALSHQKILDILRTNRQKSDDPALDEALSFIILGAENLSDAEIAELKRELESEYWKERKKELILAVRRAEESGDEARLLAALEELRNLPQTMFES